MQMVTMNGGGDDGAPFCGRKYSGLVRKCFLPGSVVIQLVAAGGKCCI